ncbi:MAG: lipid-A-disaccharide synthase [Mariprofundaceae bacterium]|nr:lipid-A-disaccharide synthase [Mariprofundaceae bacterium]
MITTKANKPSHHILICVGEPSGDLHGSAVIHALRQQDSPIHISAVAGSTMRAVGCNEIAAMESLNVMGISDVIRALPRIRRVAASILQWVEEEHPDLVILVDFPGFNMRLGARLRAAGIPVLYYIAPKLWAWGRWRIPRLQQAQDRLASILPFEHPWFSPHGIDAHYVGNPSAYACLNNGWTRQELCQQAGLNPGAPVLALLPGSRSSELQRHAFLLAEIAQTVRQKRPEVQCVCCRAPGISDAQLQPLLDAGVVIVDRLAEGYAMRADAAVAVSGTATLELALWQVPTVLVYRNSALTVWLARRLVGTRCAGLANILLDDQPVMPECIQEYATTAHVIPLLLPLLDANSEANQNQRAAFRRLQSLLGDHNPAIEVARMATTMM